MLRNLAIRCVEGLARRGGADSRLLVLIYHRVLPDPDDMYPYDPDVATFRQHMTALSQDFQVVRLAEAVQLLDRNTLPARAVAITFDDGFADNFTCALPVLKDLGLSATFFVASGYLGGGCMFNDLVIEACRQAPSGHWPTGTAEFGDVAISPAQSRRELAYRMIGQLKYLEAARRLDCAHRLVETSRATLPAGIMMTRQQVRQLQAAGMDIGGHTHSHPILSTLGDTDAEREISDGAAALADITGSRIELFAYPNGQPGRDYRGRDVSLVRRLGFRAAVSTAWGFADRQSDRHQIPRVGSWGSSAWRFSGRLALARRGSRGETCVSETSGAGR